MICYIAIQEIVESGFRRNPVKRAHGKVIVFAKVNCKLSLEVVERVEGMCCVKVLIVLTVRAFHFAVMARGERSYQLMCNLSLFESALKERKIVGHRAAETFGKLKAVVGLNAFDGKAKLLKVIEHMNKKLRGGIGTVLFKGFKITVS